MFRKKRKRSSNLHDDAIAAYIYSLESMCLWHTPFLLRDEVENKTRENDVKVIFNDPATIMWINGNKYVSKAYNEEFDMEKGLLMCLAKANGISHADLNKMLKNAEIQVKKDKKEKV